MWSSKIQHNGPTSGLIKYWLGRILLQSLGWKVEGEFPADSKFIMVGAHHTSNWDFVIGLSAMFVYRLRGSWMGKASLFHQPVGWFMRALGGIAIDRAASSGVVEQMVEQFNQHEKLVVLIAAKGTRSKTDFWKSGFYQIALQAKVPVVCGSIDYSTRTARAGNAFLLSGDVKQDMDRIRAYFEKVQGKYPELEDNIRLREEQTVKMDE